MYRTDYPILLSMFPYCLFASNATIAHAMTTFNDFAFPLMGI